MCADLDIQPIPKPGCEAGPSIIMRKVYCLRQPTTVRGVELGLSMLLGLEGKK